MASSSQQPELSPKPRHIPANPDPTVKIKRKRQLYERRIRVFSLLASAPALIISAVLISLQSWTLESKITLIAILVIVSVVLEAMLHDQVIRPLQTLTNVISALREEDYSFRARGAGPNDALGELAREINTLADLLADQRTHVIEATELLRRVLEEIDVPLFTFDRDESLKLVNSAGERLLQQPAARLLGRSADEIGLTPYLISKSESHATFSPFNSNSRWLVRRVSFRQKGVPHTLVVLSDVSQALREEERSAWQRLIRVLGHELNNSLTPIKSIAGTLSHRLPQAITQEDQRKDFAKGLAIIESRSASLNRFLQAYRQLAQMPRPTLTRVQLRPLLERIAALEIRVPVKIEPGPEASLMIDPDQFEQMLINIVRNAADAALQTDTHGESSATPAEPAPLVNIFWELIDSSAVIQVLDNGPGLLNPENAFVPFYTTKSGGSGIGLVLSRQIIEAHGGSIQLLNRSDVRGCAARISIPLADSNKRAS